MRDNYFSIPDKEVQHTVIRPERLLLVKERYLALTDYDVVQADLLSRLVALQGHLEDGEWVKRSKKEFCLDLAIPVSERTVKRKLELLVESGLVEKKLGSRPIQYRVDTKLLATRVIELHFILFEGVIIDTDEFILSNTIPMEPTVTGQVVRLRPPVRGQVVQLATPLVDKVSSKDESVSGQVVQLEDPLVDRLSSKENSLVDKVSSKEPDKVSESAAPRIIENKLTKTSTNEDSRTTGEVPTGEANVDSRTTDLTLNVNSCAPSEKEDTGPKRRKNRFYDWRHYAQFTGDDWTAAKTEGKWPGKENPRTLIIGAYLLAMHKRHKQDVGLVPADFGKYTRLALLMLEFFTEANDGDFLAGFNDSLDWVREFVSAPPESWYGKEGYPINLLFMRDQYRQKGSAKFKPRGKRANDTGVVIMTPEARAEAHKHVRRVVDGRVQ